MNHLCRPTFYRIFKKKSTEDFQSVPYVVALFSSMLWIYYAWLKSNAILLITINAAGCVIETIYIALYIVYALKSARAQVVRTKSVEFMPFWLSFFLALSAVMWFFYGLLLKDIYIGVPNVVGFVLGLLQMLLYTIYKNHKKSAEEQKLPTMLKSSTSEVQTVCCLPNFDENRDAKDQTKHDQGEPEYKSIDVSNQV
ncbi:unnamed protein product [Ilex paraguariensis]|uniref:Sugar transporter SWEET1 n=1 Tax=Ilex paraguariensis TaxID=185542 RepID=A0ABC8TPR4_9AQUA